MRWNRIGLAAALLVAACGLERLGAPEARIDGGSDAGPPAPGEVEVSCQGNVRVCDDLPEDECDASPNCTFARTCMSARSFRCSSLTAQNPCVQVPGCRWLGACVGHPEPGHCETLEGASCDDAAACERVPEPSCVPRQHCVHTPASLCDALEGCSAPCPTFHRLCGEHCVEVARHPEHCGRCGATCLGVCEGGECFAYGACTSDADCVSFDDGNPCDGNVRCVGGACQRTEPVRCDDGFDCTEDVCNTTTGACEHRALDGLCAPWERCDPSAGCAVEPRCILGSCPEGQGCYPGDVAYCAPQGEGVEGANCDVALDCVEGLDCLSVSGIAGLRTCARRCTASADCPGEACWAGACTYPCSLLPGDTVCGADLRCLNTTGGDTYCAASGLTRVGERCTTNAQCERDAICIRESSGAVCRRSCDPSRSRSCPSGSCSSTELVVGGVRIGFCP